MAGLVSAYGVTAFAWWLAVFGIHGGVAALGHGAGALRGVGLLLLGVLGVAPVLVSVVFVALACGDRPRTVLTSGVGGALWCAATFAVAVLLAGPPWRAVWRAGVGVAVVVGGFVIRPAERRRRAEIAADLAGQDRAWRLAGFGRETPGRVVDIMATGRSYNNTTAELRLTVRFTVDDTEHTAVYLGTYQAHEMAALRHEDFVVRYDPQDPSLAEVRPASADAPPGGGSTRPAASADAAHSSLPAALTAPGDGPVALVDELERIEGLHRLGVLTPTSTPPPRTGCSHPADGTW